MTKPALCVNPIDIENLKYEPVFADLMPPERLEHLNQMIPYQLDLEPTSNCAGSCAYCFSGSTPSEVYTIPFEKLKEIINQARDIGLVAVDWVGGDPLMHPNWYELVSYVAEKGMRNWICSSGLISKRQARQICQLGPAVEVALIHIDTINQEHYNQVHTDPKTLDQKVQGYRNLLEAGYPPNKIIPCMTLTRPILDSVNDTLDWYLDEMGAPHVAYVTYKLEGFAGKHLDWEPSKSALKRVFEYRAQRLGEHWLKIGSSDGGFTLCRTLFGISFKGDVAPCLALRDLAVGNIYQESLTEIFEKHRDELMFNYKIKGFCEEECENRQFCNGCRSTAYHYTGDVHQSDPKCFWNPANPEYCGSPRQ